MAARQYYVCRVFNLGSQKIRGSGGVESKHPRAGSPIVLVHVQHMSLMKCNPSGVAAESAGKVHVRGGVIIVRCRIMRPAGLSHQFKERMLFYKGGVCYAV